MPVAQELEQIMPGLFIWQVYDRAVKADLFSTALETPSGTYFIDPVPLEAACWRSLVSGREVAGIVVTNDNHWRATSDFATRLRTTVHFHETLLAPADLPRKNGLQDKAILSPGLTAIAIDGGPRGEMAVYCEGAGGTMVVGDALINFEPHGFSLLPAKYCSDVNTMRQSLPKLLEFSFERLFFAHGTPILSGARARLEGLLTRDC